MVVVIVSRQSSSDGVERREGRRRRRDTGGWADKVVRAVDRHKTMNRRIQLPRTDIVEVGRRSANGVEGGRVCEASLRGIETASKDSTILCSCMLSVGMSCETKETGIDGTASTEWIQVAGEV